MPPAESRTVPRIHIVGRKNAGKTTLICDLTAELTRRNVRVATIKHTHHHHELDTPGKDSHKHRESGARGVGILSPDMTAAFVPVRRDTTTDSYTGFQTLFSDCDLILVEGDLHTDAPRLEVWRDALAEMPYAADDESILAVITDDQPEARLNIWARSDINQLVSKLLSLITAHEADSQ